MLRNYLLTALRNARRNKGVTAINVFGLAMSMAVCLLVLQILRVQDSFDEFHTHADRTYRAYSNYQSSNNEGADLYGTAPAMLADVLRAEVSGVEAAIHVLERSKAMASTGSDPVPLAGVYADPEFFDVFSFELAAGEAATALSEPGKVVLSATAARRLFGDRPALGQVVQLEYDGDLEVTGVLVDRPYHTVIPIESITSMATIRTSRARLFESWRVGLNHSFTFLRLAPGVSPAQVQERIDTLTPQRFPEDDGNILHRLILEPIGDMNLGASLKSNEIGFQFPLQAAWFLAGLVGLVMVMAGFNYWSLSVARALRRSKEVGVRKTAGATRGALLLQFMVEAAVYVVASTAVAMGLLNLLLAGFNGLYITSMVDLGLSTELWHEPGFYLSIAAFAGCVAVAAGVYPALHLSRFRVAESLKGSNSRHLGGIALRRVLLISQFAASLLFVVTTTAVSSQIQHMIEIDYGLRREGVINVTLHDVAYEVFREDALAIAGVKRVAGTSIIPAMGSRSDRWAATIGGTAFKGYRYNVDEGFLHVLDLKLLAGRNFDGESAGSLIINEFALTYFGFASPQEAVGQNVVLGDAPQSLQDSAVVIGVVRDFQSNAVIQEPSPIFLANEHWFKYACVLTDPRKTAEVLARLHDVWRGYGLMRPFEGDSYERQIANGSIIQGMGDVLAIVRVVTMLAVAIACLGLLGIAAYAAESRVKEVGIRKAIGATTRHLVLLLSREQAVLVTIATLVALPAAVILNQLWLDQLAQRVTLGIGTVAGAALLLLALASVTVASQTVRAALANPVDSLRNE